LGGAVSRTGVLFAAAAPLFGDKQAIFATTVLILFSIPTTVFGALWVPVPGLTTKISDQPKLMGDRIRLANIGSVTANIIFSIGILFLEFPYNFIYIYVVCAVLGAIEIVTISRIKVYDLDVQAAKGFLEKLKGQSLRKEHDYFLFIGGIGLAIAALSVATPLQSVYFLKTLELSDRWLIMWAILLNLGAIVGITFWKKVQERVGSYRIFSMTVVLASFYYLFIAVFPNKYLILLAVFYIGVMNSGTDLGITLGLYRLGTEERRDLLINIYVGVSLAIAFVAALNLKFFSDHFALTTIFIGSFIIRFVVALYFSLPKMRARFSDR